MARKKGTRLTAAQRAKCISGTFTPDRRRIFLDAYVTGCSVRVAARKAGVADVAVYRAVRRDEEFARQYAEAREINLDCLEDLLHRHALAGNVSALFGILNAKRASVWKRGNTIQVEDGGFAAAFAAAMSTTEATPVGTAAETNRPRHPVH